ncbi:MAG TPA: LEA type 2 family protein [Longimicrobiaceae bacterium]
MKARTTIRALFSILAVALLAGCGAFGFRQPKVELESVTLGGLGLRGGTLLVNVQVDNPNGFSLRSERLRYSLSVRDTESADADTWLSFAEGTYDREFTVGAGERRSIQIPVEFSYSGLGGAASSILRAGTFDYRANGTVDVDTPVGTRSVPFTKRGTFTMSGAR